jgi:hypothetical protein
MLAWRSGTEGTDHRGSAGSFASSYCRDSGVPSPRIVATKDRPCMKRKGEFPVEALRLGKETVVPLNSASREKNRQRFNRCPGGGVS